MIGVSGSSAAAIASSKDNSTKDSDIAVVPAEPGSTDPNKPTDQDGTSGPEPEKKRLPGQAQVARLYNGDVVQIMVACLIGANFLTNIVEKEIDPKGTEFKTTFQAFELFYNIAFTIELMVNMYAHWWRTFWASSWNIFDVIVVSIGVINTINLPLPKAFSLLRMMRAFRVFRLFKRVRSLNKIIMAIAHAVPGVVNAFLILAIVMAIFAILAVEFFKDVGRGCHPPLADGTKDTYFTARYYCEGNEYFGTFSKSLYTFFQVLTGESWSEMIARPVIWFYPEPVKALGSGLFFVGFILITSFVLANVVVAVLLEKMTSIDDDPADEAATVPESETVSDLTDYEKEVASKIGRIETRVTNLGEGSFGLQEELDRAKSDMADVKDQLRLLLKAVEGKYRRAAL